MTTPQLYSETVAATGQRGGGGRRGVGGGLMWVTTPLMRLSTPSGPTALARDGGALLAADVNALEVTHRGPSHVTVIGHSYGATAVADAAAGYGMRNRRRHPCRIAGTDLARNRRRFSLARWRSLPLQSDQRRPIRSPTWPVFRGAYRHRDPDRGGRTALTRRPTDSARPGSKPSSGLGPAALTDHERY